MSVSVQQLESLIDYLEANPELALGRCTRSKEGRSLAKRLWQNCAETLNSIGADCTQKTGDGWRTYYNEYKSKLLKRIKNEKNEKSATGGGPAANILLTPLQERLYTILGRDVGEPLPGVRHNPIILEENGALANVAPRLEAGNVLDPMDINEVEVEIIDNMDMQRPITPQVEVNNLLKLEQEEIKQFKNKNKTKKTKNRNRREEKENEYEKDPSLMAATEAIQKLDDKHAEAIWAHTSAVERLASAIEKLANSLSTPPVAKRIRRQLSSSEEDD